MDKTKYRTAAYLRLSKGDGDAGSESNSISSQRLIIDRFLQENPDFELTETYVDDGYTGTNFERPAMKKMLEDIDKGLIDCVVVKDVSRFGRERIETGTYILKTFREKGIRFIAINDNYDSLTADSSERHLVMPIKTMTNDAYSMDISNKVRASQSIKREKGEFMGPYAPYGYMKDPENRNHLIVDPEAAVTVREIFARRISGMSANAIAKHLEETGVLTPSYYKEKKIEGYRSAATKPGKCRWHAKQIIRILTDEVYIGSMVQGRDYKVSYKVNKTIRRPKEEWVVVPGMHEPIVSESDFRTEQKEAQAQNRRTALYARISSENESKPSESIENQLEIMKKYVSERPELSSYREYVDRAFTGTDFNIPAFQSMMDDIREGKIDCVIVKDLSRLGRDYLETCNLMETIFPFLGVRFISVNDRYDTELPGSGNRELEIGAKNMVNEMYAKDISRRISTSREQDIERGKFTGSNAPYGYRTDSSHPLKQFVIDPGPAAVVKELFEMALAGTSFRDISREFQRRKLSTPGVYLKTGELYADGSGNSCFWRTGTISAMLKNEAYIGNMVQGKSRQRLWDGMPDTKQNRSDWVAVRGTHEPIIAEEDFLRLQELLKEKIGQSPFSRGDGNNPPMAPNKYAGLVFCGICGSPMSYSSEIRKKTRAYYFICTNDYRTDKERCGSRITEKVLDSAVAESVTSVYKRLVKNEKEADIRSLLTDRIEQEEKKYLKERNRLSGLISGIRERQASEYERYVTGGITGEEFAAYSSLCDRKCAALEKEITVMYMRLSKEDEFMKDESNSISNQRLLLKKFIAGDSSLRDTEIVEIKDDGYSGKNMQWPGMSRLLEMIRKHQVNNIIVKDFSRFSR